MSQPSQTIRVVAAVIEREGRFLVAQRAANSNHAGRWEFPGGKVETDESDADAIARELREELALQTTAVGEIAGEHRDPETPFVIIYRRVQVHGEPTCLEHAALRWADRGELERLPLAPADARFAETLLTESR